MARKEVPCYETREFAKIVGKSTSWVTNKILTSGLTGGLTARKGRLPNGRWGYLIPKERAFKWLKRKFPELHADAVAQAVKWRKKDRIIGTLPTVPMGKSKPLKLIETPSPHPCPFTGCQVACQTQKCVLWGIGCCTGIKALVEMANVAKTSATLNEKMTSMFGDYNNYHGIMLLKKQ